MVWLLAARSVVTPLWAPTGSRLAVQLPPISTDDSSTLNALSDELAVHLFDDVTVSEVAFTVQQLTAVHERADDQFNAIGETLGDIDPGLDRALDVETARPLIAALPDEQRNLPLLGFFDNMTQSQIGERPGYSQMHISRVLTKALNTLRSQVREPDLAVTA